MLASKRRQQRLDEEARDAQGPYVTSASAIGSRAPSNQGTPLATPQRSGFPAGVALKRGGNDGGAPWALHSDLPPKPNPRGARRSDSTNIAVAPQRQATQQQQQQPSQQQQQYADYDDQQHDQDYYGQGDADDGPGYTEEEYQQYLAYKQQQLAEEQEQHHQEAAMMMAAQQQPQQPRATQRQHHQQQQQQQQERPYASGYAGSEVSDAPSRAEQLRGAMPAQRSRPSNRIDRRQDELWNAVAQRDFAEVQRLVGKLGVEPDFISYDGSLAAGNGGRSLLNHAAWIGDAQIFAYLCENGADMRSRVKGTTPFHQACFYNKLAIVSYCLANGADPNLVGEDGYTPLHLAAKHGYVKLIQALMDAGADPNVATKADRTPWDLANVDTRDAMPGLRPTIRRDPHKSSAPRVSAYAKA